MEPEKKRPRIAGRWLLVLTVAVVIAVPIAIGGIWWLRRGTPEPVVAQGPAPPLAPEPASPPSPWKAELAAIADAKADGTATAELQQRIKGISGVASILAPELAKMPPEPTAPAALLVLPGDVRTVEAISRIPRHERWEIQFPPGNTIDSYSRQLDFFKIELGVIGDGDKVVYLANLSAPTPTSRSEPAGRDQRLYLVWQRGAMREAAEELVSRAKVDPRGKVLAHFCPSDLETQLAQLEDDHARQKGLHKIRRTRFGVKPNDTGGYAFYVIDQKAEQ